MGSTRNFGHTAFCCNVSVGFHCLFGMGQYSFLPTPVLNKQESPKDRITHKRVPWLLSHCLLLLSAPFHLSSGLLLFLAVTADANSHWYALNESFHPHALCHLFIVWVRGGRINPKCSTASLKLITDEKSRKSTRRCAKLV